MSTVTAGDVGVVVIGRNEGERLRQCLTSLVGQVAHIIYVDSGSTDGSIAVAQKLGVHVAELDLSIPFTAARARNAGFKQLTAMMPDLAFIQFVDGDCELEKGWIAAGLEYLTANPQTGVVFGRRRERYPERSVYNQLCDLEWAVPAGETKTCGGDALMRVQALQQAGGYRPDLIAGEEPELCVRLRQAGWKIFCIDHPMTVHDAAMMHFGQWWRRSVRAGYAFAQGRYIHGAAPEYMWFKETRRIWLWGAVMPVIIAVSTILFGAWALVLALVYPAQILRLYLNRRHSKPIPFMSSLLHVMGRFAEAAGQIKFEIDRFTGHNSKLIEYK